MMQLYDQYRPRSWPEFIGQDKAIARIRAVSGRDGFDRGAFLFQGPSGSGKTSAALVLARELGTMDVHTEFVPSQECSVDTIRDIAELARYGAFDGGWKVWIIDEAHLMSKAARDALLSLAEQLPAKRAIVMTTTEADCFDETLFSRFYVVQFAKPNADQVAAHIERIAAANGYEIPNPKRYVQDRHNNIRRCLSDLEIDMAASKMECAA